MLFSQDPVIKVLVVDDDALTRLSLKLLLSSEENINVVGLASNGIEAIDLVKTHNPDVVILDLQMPVMNGLIAASAIERIAPQVYIIAYSLIEDPQVEVMSQTAPIDFFCTKETSNEKLIELIKQIGQRSLLVGDC
jgi:DNA-binding NarL/FixJ family response regulator